MPVSVNVTDPWQWATVAAIVGLIICLVCKTAINDYFRKKEVLVNRIMDKIRKESINGKE